MVETLQEFIDEIRTIKQEIYLKGESADPKLLASWLDKLLISLEKIAPSLELMAVELAEISEVIAAIQEKKAAPAKKAKKAKKAKPKKAKGRKKR